MKISPDSEEDDKPPSGGASARSRKSDDEERPAARAHPAALLSLSLNVSNPPPVLGRRHSVESVGAEYSVESLERPFVSLARRRFWAVAASAAIALCALVAAPPVGREFSDSASPQLIASHLGALAAWLTLCAAALAAGKIRPHTRFGLPSVTAVETELACLGIVAWANYALLHATAFSPAGVPLLVAFTTAGVMRVGGGWGRLPKAGVLALAASAALAYTVAFAASPHVRALPQSWLAFVLVYAAAAEGAAAGLDSAGAAEGLWDASVGRVRALDALAAIGASAAAAALEREGVGAGVGAAAAAGPRPRPPPLGRPRLLSHRRGPLGRRGDAERGALDLSSPLERAIRLLAIVKLRAASERRVDEVHVLDEVEDLLAHSENLSAPPPHPPPPPPIFPSAPAPSPAPLSYRPRPAF
eukprot:tig00021374_g21092.t1